MSLSTSYFRRSTDTENILITKASLVAHVEPILVLLPRRSRRLLNTFRFSGERGSTAKFLSVLATLCRHRQQARIPGDYSSMSD